MIISSSEFQNNVDKFLKHSANEDIIITQNGKEIARLVGANNSYLVDSLVGILPQELDVEAELRERAERRYGIKL